MHATDSISPLCAKRTSSASGGSAVSSSKCSGCCGGTCVSEMLFRCSTAPRKPQECGLGWREEGIRAPHARRHSRLQSNTHHVLRPHATCASAENIAITAYNRHQETQRAVEEKTTVLTAR